MPGIPNTLTTLILATVQTQRAIPCTSDASSDTSKSNEGARGDSSRRRDLLLLEKLSAVEEFVNLAFWKGLNQLVEFLGEGLSS